MTVVRTCCPKVLEVEGQDRQAGVLGNCHNGSVDDAEIEVGETFVDRHGPAEQVRAQVHDCVLTARHGGEEEARCVCRHSGSQQLVDLDENEVGDNEVSSEFRHERCGQPVRPVATVRGSDERAGVGDDSQRISTSSRR